MFCKHINILHEDIMSRALGKYTTYHPCKIIIQYNSKKVLLTIKKKLTNACQKSGFGLYPTPTPTTTPEPEKAWFQ